MQFSSSITLSIHQCYLNRSVSFGLRRQTIETAIAACRQPLRTVLEFYYATMPAADLGQYPVGIYRQFAEWSLARADDCPWPAAVPEDVFLAFVAAYRVNNESIEPHRPLFYQALAGRIAGLDMRAAALAVNIWCAGQVTYRSSDDRTLSPLALMKSLAGRCGEESTFLVAALRSVGLPARQVYTPRWAHCDDNHAWVEVWCDGQWYYMGACEPEPVLNRGWFTEAAARAMLVDCRSPWPVAGEDILAHRGGTALLNEIDRYAPAGLLQITLLDRGLPAPGIPVFIELLNSAELFPIAELETDGAGCARIRLGLGSVHIRIVVRKTCLERLMQIEEHSCLTIDLADEGEAGDNKPDCAYTLDFTAPADQPRNRIILTETQARQKSAVLRQAAEHRSGLAAGFYQAEEAKTLAARFPDPPRVLEILQAAAGNFQEISKFLRLVLDSPIGCDSAGAGLALLNALPVKDYLDVQADFLYRQMLMTADKRAGIADSLFIPYVLNPRILFERLTDFRQPILRTFSAGQLAAFRENPPAVWDYVAKTYREAPDRENSRPPATPVGILNCGYADETGRKLLCVAILRTLAIPARLDPFDLSVQYAAEGEMVPLHAETPGSGRPLPARITFAADDQPVWKYNQNWTLARYQDGRYETLQIPKSACTDLAAGRGRPVCRLLLQPGKYRVITANRLPNGNQLAWLRRFTVQSGREMQIGLVWRQARQSELLEDIPLDQLPLGDISGRLLPLDALPQAPAQLMIWLAIGREPTEHILNELIEAAGDLNKMALPVGLAVAAGDPEQQETFVRAAGLLQQATVYRQGPADAVESLARRLYLDPDQRPLVVLLDARRHVRFAFAGYQVGLASLLIRLAGIL
ncbi:MAG: transglutaminase-like domain-containing protein [Clostridiaceae bacterium]|nr:transglutaminase-like domain-containing protein [Clostridiaceae bacterium]